MRKRSRSFVQELSEKFLARQIAERRSAQTIADDRWRLKTFSRVVGKSRVRTDLLYWDDLGQMHLTGSASERLLHVVEERSNSEMPILPTTQYSGEGIDAQFERKEMWKAIRRRLNEFCRVVVVRSVADQPELSMPRLTARDRAGGG
jgi:hypothetical protein